MNPTTMPPHAPATRRRLARLTALCLLGIGAFGMAACSDSDDGASSTGTSDHGVASDSAYGSKCSPVGEDLADEATQTVDVTLADYAFGPADLKATPGVVTFAVKNTGKESHELAFLPGGGDVPFTDDGAPDEDALEEAGAFELEAFPPGEECRATYKLEAGTYSVFCIVEAEDGTTHYEKGMRGTLTVS